VRRRALITLHNDTFAAPCGYCNDPEVVCGCKREERQAFGYYSSLLWIPEAVDVAAVAGIVHNTLLALVDATLPADALVVLDACAVALAPALTRVLQKVEALNPGPYQGPLREVQEARRAWGRFLGFQTAPAEWTRVLSVGSFQGCKTRADQEAFLAAVRRVASADQLARGRAFSLAWQQTQGLQAHAILQWALHNKHGRVGSKHATMTPQQMQPQLDPSTGLFVGGMCATPSHLPCIVRFGMVMGNTQFDPRSPSSFRVLWVNNAKHYAKWDKALKARPWEQPNPTVSRYYADLASVMCGAAVEPGVLMTSCVL